MEKPDRVFIVGFMGSDRMGLGKSIADEYSYELILGMIFRTLLFAPIIGIGSITL